MNEEALNDAYKLFQDTGYNGSIEDYSELINTNQDALNDSYKMFQDTGYDGDADSFSALVLGEKKNPNAPSESLDGSLPSSEVSQNKEFSADDVFKPKAWNPQDGVESIVGGSSEKPEEVVAETVVEEPKKQEWQKETEGNSRYKQAGFAGINGIISQYDKSISDKDSQVKELEQQINQNKALWAQEDAQKRGEMANVRGGQDAAIAQPSILDQKKDELNVRQKELHALKKIQRIYGEKKSMIDAEYGANFLGLGDDVSRIDKMVKAKKDTEGTTMDFFARNIAKATGFKNDSYYKQQAKEILEPMIDEEIEASSKRVKQINDDFQKTSKTINENYEQQADALGQAFQVGSMDEDAYLKARTELDTAYAQEHKLIGAEYDEYQGFAKDYLTAMQDISITNQLDDQSWFEANTKSFGNEWIKTPREGAGLVKMTAPIIAYINSTLEAPGNLVKAAQSDQSFAEIQEKSYEETMTDLLDLYSPVTKYLTEISNDNLLRVDTDRNLMTGQIAGQLSKIIPASMAAPAAAIAVTAGMSFDEMYQASIEAGLSENESIHMGTIYAPIGAALETMGSKGVMASMGKKQVLKRVIDIAKDKGLLRAGQKEASISLNKSLLMELGEDVLKGYHSEGTTELYQSGVMSAMQFLKNQEMGESKFDLSPSSVAQDLIASYGYGGLAGGVISMGGSIVNVAQGKRNVTSIPYALYRQSLTDPNLTVRITQRVSDDPNLTQQEKVDVMARMKTDRETFESVSKLGLSENEEKLSVELISQKKEYEAVIETQDKAMTKDLQDQVKDINERLANIYRESKGKPAEETTLEKKADKEVKDSKKEASEPKVEKVSEPDTSENVSLTDKGNKSEVAENKGEKVAENTTNTENETAENAPEKQGTLSESKESDVYVMGGEKGAIRKDGQTYVFETKDKIIELGNVDEMSDKDVSEFGIEKESKMDVSIDENNNVSLDGKVYVNNNSDPLAAINTDKDGNVVSVNLETESGQKRTIRGQRAEEIAYQYKLKEFEQNATEKEVGTLEQEIARIEEENAKPIAETKERSVKKLQEDAVNEASQTESLPESEAAMQGVEAAQKPETDKSKESSTVKEVISDKEYNDFVDSGTVSEGTLSSIAEKYKGGETLSIREQAIFSDKVKEINDLLADKKPPKKEKTNKKPSPPKENAKVSESETNKKPEPEKSKKEAKKEKVFKTVDDVVDLFKDILGADLPEGTKLQSIGGLSQNDILDTAAKIVKAMIGKGIDIQQAIQDVVAKLKANKLIENETKFLIDLIEATREPKITVNTYTTQAEKIAAEANMSGAKVGLIPDSKRGSYMIGRRTKDIDLLEAARQAYKSGQIDIVRLIDRITSASDVSNIAISPMQVAAMIHYKADLDANVRDAEKRFKEAQDSGNVSQEIILKAVLDGLYADQNRFFNAVERTGAAQSGGFRLRQYMLEDQYDATYQKGIIQREIDPDGKLGYKLDAEIEAKLEEQAAEIKRMREEVDKADAESKRLAEKLYSLGTQKSGNQPTKKRRTATKEQAKKIAEKLRGAKVKNGFSNTLYSNPVIPLMKAAWNVSIEASALAIETAGATADIINVGIRAGLKALRGTEWYKSLNTNDKKRARKDIEEGVRDMADSALENNASEITRNEDGEIQISHSYISALVDEGFDTLDKAKNEIERRLKEQGDTNFTDVEILDAINGYKKVSETTTPDLQRKVSELKSLAGLNAKLAKLRENEKIPKNARKRREQTKEENILKKQIAKAEKNLTFTDAEIKEIWQETFNDTKKSLETLKDKLQEQLDEAKSTGEVVNAKSSDTIKESVKKDAEIQTLQTEIQNIRDQISSLSQMKDVDFMRKAQVAEKALKKSIENIQKQLKTKKFDPVTQKAPIETDALKDLRKQKEVLEKQRDEERWGSDYGKKKRSETRVKKLQSKIDKIDDQINRRVGLATKRRAKDASTVQERLLENIVKQKQEALKQTQHYIDFANKKYNEMAEKRANQQIDKYEQILKDFDATGNIPEFKREQKEFSKSLRDLKRRQATAKIKVDILREKAIFQAKSKPEKILRNLMMGAGLPISLMASFDFSMVLRQGLPLALANPKQGIKAFKDMAKYGLKIKQSYTDEFMEGMKDWKYYDLAKQSKLYLSEPGAKLSAQEENFMGRLVQKIPHVRISSNLYNVYLNSLRMGVFEKFADLHIEGGRNAIGFKQGGVDLGDARTEKMFGDMAKFVNNITGRGSMLWTDGLQTSPIMNMLFFAPKYMTSRFNVVANTLGFGYAILYHPAVALEAYRTVSTYVGVGMMSLALLKLAGFEVEDDPRSTDFGKIKIDDDIRIDMWAGFVQVARLLAVTAAGSKKTIKGDVKELNEGGYKQNDVAGIWGQFLRSKLSPFSSAAWDWASREKGLTQENMFGMDEPVVFTNLVGENQTFSERLTTLVSPLALQDIVSIWEDKGWKLGASLFPIALGGAGVQYFKPKEGEMSDKPNFTEEELENALLDDAMNQEDFDDMMYDDSFDDLVEDDLDKFEDQ